VIRTVDSFYPSVDGASGVIGMTDALEDERQLCERTQPWKCGPAQLREVPRCPYLLYA
jgi:hypothetical protein